MDYLYEVEGKVTPSCASSHITYSFFVVKPYKTIKCFFEYSPKNLNNEEQSKKIILESLRKYGYEDSGHGRAFHYFQ
ncbi:hypothetical protein ABES02_23340 [Neobacillus pocheonensis]|uniref:hypothetical protein n=1 Tax=Neobacillus pocheonensis TaxID=363869 RepID=UPI003D28AB2F